MDWMFSIDFDDKRVKSFLRTLQYLALTILVVGATIILVYVSEGYDINRNTGEVVQNGLVLLDSQPDGATVTINGQQENDKTPSKFPLPAGEYDFVLTRDDYRSWQKTIKVEGGSVEWHYYPILIPNTVTTKNLTAFRSNEFNHLYGNRLLTIYLEDSKPMVSVKTFSAQAISDEVSFALPSELFKPSSLKNISFVSSSPNPDIILLQHKSSNKPDFWLINLDSPEESDNLTKLFDLDITKLRFVAGEEDKFYGLVDGDLRLLDLNAKQVSVPIASNVSDFRSISGDYLVYLQQNNQEQSSMVQLGIKDGETQFVVDSYPGTTQDFGIDLTEYDGNIYVAVFSRSDSQATIYTNPHQDNSQSVINSTLIITLGGAEQLKISPNARFISLQSPKNFLVYDLEEKDTYRFSLAFEPDLKQAPDWIDGYRFYAFDLDSNLHIFEFDGNYDQVIAKSNPNYPALMGSSSENIYSITPKSPNSEALFLQASSLLAEEN